MRRCPPSRGSTSSPRNKSPLPSETHSGLLGPELEVGQELRRAFDHMSDAKLAALMWVGGRNSLMDMIRDKADFDWHRPLLDELMGHRVVGQFLKVGGARAEGQA